MDTKITKKTECQVNSVDVVISVSDLKLSDNLHYVFEQMLDVTYQFDDILFDKDRGEFIQFCRIWVKDGNTSSGLESFFDFMMSFPGSGSYIIEFIQNIIRWSSINRTNLWVDDGNYLGQEFSFRLAKNNHNYVDLYCDFIDQCEMGYETSQFEEIDFLIEKYGFTKSILRLLAYRASTAFGQHGGEQMEKYKSRMREYFLTSPRFEQQFTNTTKLT